MAAVLRAAVMLAGVVVACAAVAGAARADGDPASDILVAENVFLPYQRPAPAASASLVRQITAVYASGNRIKVAVIAAKSDLGAIPSLFGKASDYAAFLGQELDGIYVGPLLVVMPSGYGIYDGGRSVSAEQSVLDQLAAPASSRPDDLVAAATAAVAKMLDAGALKSADILPPYVQVLGGTFARGRLTVRFYADDDSGHATVSATVTRGSRVLLQREIPSPRSTFSSVQVRAFTVRKGSNVVGARLCLKAVDAAGNRSTPSCHRIRG
jgi:hypothetical protein